MLQTNSRTYHDHYHDQFRSINYHPRSKHVLVKLVADVFLEQAHPGHSTKSTSSVVFRCNHVARRPARSPRCEKTRPGRGLLDQAQRAIVNKVRSEADRLILASKVNADGLKAIDIVADYLQTRLLVFVRSSNRLLQTFHETCQTLWSSASRARLKDSLLSGRAM